MDDPRRVLEQASEMCVTCEILPRRGGWSRGRMVRVERGGVVVLAPNLQLSAGEDVRCWFALEGRPYTFEASVIRTGVPVPDRSQHGLLLGFLDGWTEGESHVSTHHGLDIGILPPNGPAFSIMHGPGRLMEISVGSLVFMLPVDNTLLFLEGGSTRLCFSVPGEPRHEVDARVSNMVPGDTHFLYTLVFEGLEEPDLHRRLVAALQMALEEGTA